MRLIPAPLTVRGVRRRLAMTKKKILMEKIVVYGIERLRNGEARTMMVPVEKGDRIEWTHQGFLTRIFRDDKPLHWLGQRIGWTPEGNDLVVLHLTVVHEPGQIRPEELADEGFETLEDLRGAFGSAFGAERLWKAAWRITCGVNRIFVETEAADAGSIRRR